jgi:pyruvate kinase
MNRPSPVVVTSSTASGLLDELLRLRFGVIRDAGKRLDKYRAYNPAGTGGSSARNLAHYLSLRKYDLRGVQARLAELGLSSLGRGESHILSNLDGVLANLAALARVDIDPPVAEESQDPVRPADLLRERANQLFGDDKELGRSVRIMVTLPSDAATDRTLAVSLLQAGMDVARINCAHDSPHVWQQMILNLRAAELHTGRSCRILMDLAGPKVRTTVVPSAARVLHVKAPRDEFGRITGFATVSLISEDAYRTASTDSIGDKPGVVLPADLCAKLAPGDHLRFVDTRGKERSFSVRSRCIDGVATATCARTAYIAADTSITWIPAVRRVGEGLQIVTVSAVAGRMGEIRLHRGDRFVLSPVSASATPEEQCGEGAHSALPCIRCTSPDIVSQLVPGQSVWLDDGRLGAVVEQTGTDGIIARVTVAGPKGCHVRSGRGLNFPDTELLLPALTIKDIADLDFVCRHADMIGYSFVQSVEDMDALLHQLASRGASHLPVVMKIETRRAVRNLPGILLSIVDRHPVGVMIARGDLAVELGSVDMAEIQEELLWLCEAARIPVIWATQVLESMAKTGVVARSEITDAAMGVRAECVMLNKGPFIVETVRTLGDILCRMQSHQYKKDPRLSPLPFEY